MVRNSFGLKCCSPCKTVLVLAVSTLGVSNAIWHFAIHLSFPNINQLLSIMTAHFKGLYNYH